MPTYDLIKDFGAPEGADTLSLSPAAVIAVFRRKYPVTYSRKFKGSLSQNLDFATKLRDRVTIIDDISSVSVTFGKSSHVATANVELKPGVNYISELLPGDFIFIWMVQTKEAAERVVERLDGGHPCNRWEDGLKFFGRINSCRKKMITEGATGLRRTSFILNALAFTELDASIYFEPYMALPPSGLVSSWLQYFGTAISQFVSGSDDSNGGVTTNLIVPALYNILFGKGIPKNANVTIGSSDVRLTEGLDNPNTFIIPTEVASVFGVTQGGKANGAVGWNDIMEFTHGVQSFNGTQEFLADQPVISEPEERQRGALMTPTIAIKEGKIGFTGVNQMGTFMPQTAAFTGQKNIWTLLKQFVNETTNEMFTGMRVNTDGRVFPALILRQLPFTSGLISSTYIPPDPLTPEQRKKADDFIGRLDAVGEFSEEGKRLLANYRKTKEFKENGYALIVRPPEPVMHGVTRFAEVPRWRIPPILVGAFDVGRSDSLRMNYVHVYGEAGIPAGVNQTRQFVINKPIRDDIDIARSGLRPYMATVPCSPKDIVYGGAGAWMNLIADIVMNQELTLTGVLNMYGIVAPISPGDNIEYDGVIAHIETVGHTFSVAPNGVCTFRTQVEFTHGVSAEQLSEDEQDRYVGLRKADVSTFDPTVLTEQKNPTTGTGTDAADNEIYNRGAQEGHGDIGAGAHQAVRTETRNYSDRKIVPDQGI